jgi:hypothetical protein
MHTEQIDVPWKYKRNFLQQDIGGSIILESPVNVHVPKTRACDQGHIFLYT